MHRLAARVGCAGATELCDDTAPTVAVGRGRVALAVTVRVAAALLVDVAGGALAAEPDNAVGG